MHKGSTDPFGTLPVSMNQDSHVLIQFYLTQTSTCPWVWETQQRKSLEDDNYRITVADCLLSQLRFSSFLSLTSVLMKIFGSADIGSTLSPVFIQQALAEIRNEITSGTRDQAELLYGISRISLAAVLDEDDSGARTHLKAAQHLLNRAPWSHIYDSSIPAYLSYADMHLAVTSISAPMLAQPPNTSVPTPFVVTIPAEMEDDACELLEKSQTYFADCSGEAYASVLRCFVVLKALKQKQIEVSLQSVGFELSSVLGRLLHATYEPTQTLCSRDEWESAKASLVLWLQILGLCMNGMISVDITVRSHVTRFSRRKMDSMDGAWPACVCDGLSMWNSTVDSEISRQPCSFSMAFECLLRAADLTVELSPVRIASFVREILQKPIHHDSESALDEPGSTFATPSTSVSD